MDIASLAPVSSDSVLDMCLAHACRTERGDGTDILLLRFLPIQNRATTQRAHIYLADPAIAISRLPDQPKRVDERLQMIRWDYRSTRAFSIYHRH